MTQAPAVTRAQVLAFRLAGQHLAEPLSPDRLPEAAGACGLRDTPPGSAPLGLLPTSEAGWAAASADVVFT